MLGHRDQSFAHSVVEKAGRVDRNNGDDTGVLRHLYGTDPAGDRHHVDAIHSPTMPDSGAMEREV